MKKLVYTDKKYKRVNIENFYYSKRESIENLDSYKIGDLENEISKENLKTINIKNLEKELKKQKKIYKELKFIHYTFFYKNPMKLRITRKLIAKILTLLSSKKK